MSKKTRKFKTEVQQLLDLVINSLYSKREIFLRELISNASDAIDRLRFESLTDKSLVSESPEWKIKISADKNARTITVSDNGIGMSPEEVEKNIGTIASSGTKNFLEALRQSDKAGDLEFIGQFGVGFYSSFMVADKVALITKRAGENQEAIKWVSSGDGTYTIEPSEKESYGTDITLHLREGMDEYLDEWRIRNIVKQYSDYIAFPIVMDVVRKEKDEKDDKEVEKVVEETLNSMKAIWKKSKDEVTEEEYNEFYKHISHDYAEPLKVIHYFGEGTTEFKALLYIPSQAPIDLFWRESRRGIRLYVKNVFIADDCEELIPEYLRFVKGVVDSSDLPLNISREMLQDDAIIRRIRKNVVGKVLNTLAEIKDKERDKYNDFYKQFGRVLKEGLYFEFENQDKLKELVLFPSTKAEPDKPTSLKEYVERMPEEQKEIYYLTAESREAALSSPHLEIFNKKGYEALLFIDSIDELSAQRFTEYDGKKLRSINKGDIDLGTEEEKKEKEAKLKESEKQYERLLKFMQKKLESDVKEVRFSNRLTDSACCLVVDEEGLDITMEKLMKAMNQDIPPSKRILELNPDHPLLPKLKELYDKNESDPKLSDYIELLHDQALLTAGAVPRNPLKFTKLISDLMVSAG